MLRVVTKPVARQPVGGCICPSAWSSQQKRHYSVVMCQSRSVPFLSCHVLVAGCSWCLIFCLLRDVVMEMADNRGQCY